MVDSEVLRKDPAKVLNNVQKFLGLKHFDFKAHIAYVFNLLLPVHFAIVFLFYADKHEIKITCHIFQCHLLFECLFN